MSTFLCLTPNKFFGRDFLSNPKNQWEDATPINVNGNWKNTHGFQIIKAAKRFIEQCNDFDYEEGDIIEVYVKAPNDTVFKVKCTAIATIDFKSVLERI